MINTKMTSEPIRPVKLVLSDGLENEKVIFDNGPLANVLNNVQPRFYLHKNGYFILDFGKEYAGAIRIVAASKYHVRIRYGESVAETLANVGQKGATNDHALRDFEVSLPGWSDQKFSQSAFRFVRIDNLGEDIAFVKIVLQSEHSDAKKQGYFISDDERVNKIFDTSLYTAFLCIQNDYLYDGAKRDRLIWSGDLNIETHSLLYGYGDLDVLRRTLDFCEKNYPLPNFMNNMPTYNLWWVLNLNNIYTLNQDKEFLNEHIPFLKNYLNNLNKCILENGDVDYSLFGANEVSMPDFIDWPSTPDKDSHAAAIALIGIALLKASTLLKITNNDDSLVLSMLNRIKKENLQYKKSKGIISLYDLAYDEDEFNDYSANNLSTFTSYYVFHDLAKNNHLNEAISMMKEYYGGMLDCGATTFWEDYSLDWKGNPIDKYAPLEETQIHGNYGGYCYDGLRLSLCHGWSSGPVPFLYDDVAGIEQINEDTVYVKPNLGFLTNLKVGRMTSKGLLELEINKESSTIKTRIASKPKDLKVVIK